MAAIAKRDSHQALSPVMVRSEVNGQIQVQDTALLWGDVTWGAGYLWANGGQWNSSLLTANGYLWANTACGRTRPVGERGSQFGVLRARLCSGLLRSTCSVMEHTRSVRGMAVWFASPQLSPIGCA